MSSPSGAGVIRRAVDLFYDRMLADDRLGRFFDGVDLERLRAHQRAFLLAALGGPDLYDGRDMRSAHEGLGITDVEYDLALEHLEAALGEAGVDAVASARLLAQLEPLRHHIVAA